MIRFSKNFLFNPAEILIFGLNCDFNNISKIFNIFNCKWIVVTIDSIIEGSLLLTLIEEQGLKYFIKSRLAGYMEISVVIPYHLFEDFLNKAINEDPENIFVYNLLDYKNSVMCLQHSHEKLVTTGVIDVFISISLDKGALLISMNKYLIPPRGVYKKLKSLRFD